MEYVIGVDIGTTHCKCVAITPSGEVLLQVQASYPTIQHTQGQSEQEPDIILNRVLELLQKTISGLRQEHKLKAVAFSSAMHSIIPVDKSGIPLSNAFTWADTRSNANATELIEKGNQDVLYPRIGVPIHPMLPLCKIIWIRQSMPTIFSLAKKFISLKEYIFFKLFGRYIVDYSIACASGLLNINSLNWDEHALELAGIDGRRLSLPVSVFHSETKLNSEYRDLLGISDVPFIVGGSDGCLANIGSGAVSAGEGAITIGTSGAVRIVANQSNLDPLHRLFNYVVEKDFFVCGGPVNNGGIVLKWFAENFLNRPFVSNADFSWFIEEACQIQPGANGLIFLPYLLGERAPYWDSNLRGAFIGLDLIHRKEHMMRAVVEGVSFGLYSVLQAIESAYGEIKVLYASGGFTQSEKWLQILADILNKRIIVAGGTDASAVGAAIIGFCAIGSMKNIRQAKELAVNLSEFKPDSRNNEMYKQVFNVFQNAAPLLKDQFPLLRLL